jgi:N-methylhydantoinase A
VGATLGLSEHAQPHPALLIAAFERAHEQRYGYRDERAEVELVNVRVSAIGARPALALRGETAGPRVRAHTRARTRVVFDGEWVEAELWSGELPAGTCVQGPALCALPESTLLVHPGWSGAVDELGTIVLEREGYRQDRPDQPSAGMWSGI